MAPPAKVETDLPVVQGLWIGPSLSAMERMSIRSFLAAGHPYHLYTYDHVDGIPEGTTLLDASAILPPERVFKYSDRDTYAGFANLFRYKLLLDRGGFWADLDMICLRPLRFDADHVFGWERWKGEVVGIGNALIGAPAGSKLMEFCYEHSSGEDPEELIWGKTGPELFAEGVRTLRLTGRALPPSAFYPLAYHEWKRLLRGGLRDRWFIRRRVRHSYTLHFWNEMWRIAGRDKDAEYPPGCAYETLKQRFL